MDTISTPLFSYQAVVRKWGIHELYMAFKYTPAEFCSMSFAWSETDKTNNDGRTWEHGFSHLRTAIVRQGQTGLLQYNHIAFK